MIVLSWWIIFGISLRAEQGSGIINYIGIHIISNYELPPYLNIFIRYNDISVIMNSTLYQEGLTDWSLNCYYWKLVLNIEVHGRATSVSIEVHPHVHSTILTIRYDSFIASGGDLVEWHFL